MRRRIASINDLPIARRRAQVPLGRGPAAGRPSLAQRPGPVGSAREPRIAERKARRRPLSADRHRPQQTPRRRARDLETRPGLALRGARWVRARRVQVNGRVVRDPDFPVRQGVDRVEIEGQNAAGRRAPGADAEQAERSGDDRPGRARARYRVSVPEPARTCPGSPQWDGSTRRARVCCCSAMTRRGRRDVTDPTTGPDKTYHVQIDQLPGAAAAGASAARCHRWTVSRLDAEVRTAAARRRQARLAGNRAHRGSQSPHAPPAWSTSGLRCCAWCGCRVGGLVARRFAQGTLANAHERRKSPLCRRDFAPTGPGAFTGARPRRGLFPVAPGTRRCR